MLKIYDTNHNAIGHIVKYKDLKVASDVTTGDQTLSFTYMARHHEICEEYYIETQDAEYVVKEKSVSTDGFLSFVADVYKRQVLKDVESATDGMGDAQKQAALMATFTSDSIKGLNMLLNTGADQVAGYEESLRNCSGAASDMADTMQDNPVSYTHLFKQ